ncbi:putative phosphoesterase [Nakamurella sp. UYEF19]|uniref:metallophosphoesterase family protein n=1 Tax=Nakamurella sp. UYEF19 TaxID=1756392 RepID=UPI003394DF15
MRVAVLSDTHAPRFWKTCPPGVAQHLETAELILHAGDVCTPDVLQQLAQFAPVRVVLGNNDGPGIASCGALETVEFVIEGLPVAMIHDSGQKAGRLQRMRRRFPAADLVIFGHSHIPLEETCAGFRILNPGSPTDRRRQPTGTMALLDVQGATLVRSQIVEVPAGR